MDGSFHNASSEATAFVVRQFVPSRIERQLLSQVFDLVCGATNASRTYLGTASNVVVISADELAEQDHDPQVVGRRVA